MALFKSNVDEGQSGTMSKDKNLPYSTSAQSKSDGDRRYVLHHDVNSLGSYSRADVHSLVWSTSWRSWRLPTQMGSTIFTALWAVVREPPAACPLA